MYVNLYVHIDILLLLLLFLWRTLTNTLSLQQFEMTLCSHQFMFLVASALGRQISSVALCSPLSRFQANGLSCNCSSLMATAKVIGFKIVQLLSYNDMSVTSQTHSLRIASLKLKSSRNLNFLKTNFLQLRLFCWKADLQSSF